MVKPDVVKLDMHLIRTPHHRDTVDTAIAVAEYARRTGAMIVAEGIETHTNHRVALSLVASWGTGLAVRSARPE